MIRAVSVDALPARWRRTARAGWMAVLACTLCWGLPSSSATLVTIDLEGPPADVGEAELREWVRRSASIVAGYFGEFPVSAVKIHISTTDADRMGSGKTFGYPEPRIEVSVGRHVSPRALTDDWVLVHEMIHLSLPAIADEQNWFAEGVATYVEGVARVQAGNLGEAELWREYLTSMPQGLPLANDRGLDRTHTWARTYWGGALYCFLADVQIREHSRGRHGLQDALRAVAKRAAGMSSTWPIERVLAVGDSATGTSVMTDLYLKMKDSPFAPDLRTLWTDLGVELLDGSVRFNDSARLAAVRHGIMNAPSR